MNLAFDIPICQTSFGQVAYNILREVYARGANPFIFIKGNNANMSPFKREDEFNTWLQYNTNRSIREYDRDVPCYKLWHINGLLESYSNKNCAATFHETDRITDTEKHILEQQKVVFVSSKYTKTVFEAAGLKNVVYCPVGFDANHFHRVEDKQYYGDDIIAFGLRGKMEKRKNTLRILQVWAKKYGNNNKYRLDCSIFNQFLKPEHQEALIKQAFGGQIPFNVNFLKMLDANEVYNDALNATDIDLTGMSACEGFNLPLFQSLCIGKQAVVLDAHVHQDYCNAENSFLVAPSKNKVEALDGVFFHKGQDFNQGYWFDFDDDEFVAAMEKAEERAKERNTEGEKLKEEFTYSSMVDMIEGHTQF
jgi:hypothetical protein